MKLPALLAVFMPWVLLAVAIFVQRATGLPDAIERMGLIWLFMSPVLIAGAILVSFREGQFSMKKDS